MIQILDVEIHLMMRKLGNNLLLLEFSHRRHMLMVLRNIWEKEIDHHPTLGTPFLRFISLIPFGSASLV